MTAHILIVEDDEGLRRLLQIDLERNSYRVTTASDGIAGLEAFVRTSPDLVVLDVAMPGMSGREVCRRIREESDIPILMMSAHAITEEEIAEGLDIGADEYMVKPLGNIEFQARVNALLRRANLARSHQKQSSLAYDDGYLSVNLSTRRIRVGDKEIRLTPTEFNLLATFIEYRGKVLTFQQILEMVWGAEYKSEHHYPRIYVSHLRRKIEPDYRQPTYIHNEYGVGYRFVGQLID
ncbi:MAG: response regulator transcription factor [Anaerolineae bacterium]